jgi:transcriptional regulator
MGNTPTDLLYGTIDILVLKTLSWKAQHGYAICEWLRQRTDGELELDDAALYKSLHRLEVQGCVESGWGLSENNRRAKYYQITAAGRKHLRARSAVWHAYANTVVKVIGDA